VYAYSHPFRLVNDTKISTRKGLAYKMKEVEICSNDMHRRVPMGRWAIEGILMI
jgi:hypothetical protein